MSQGSAIYCVDAIVELLVNINLVDSRLAVTLVSSDYCNALS